MRIAVLGIDLGKDVCSVPEGHAHRSGRKTAACIVGKEACCGAHHLGRLFAAQGHDVRLMSPEYVRPYVRAQKNDDRDAEGFAEAATRPTTRLVAMKTQVQLDMQTLHRSRERLVGERTALINQLRAVRRARRSLLRRRNSGRSTGLCENSYVREMWKIHFQHGVAPHWRSKK